MSRPKPIDTLPDPLARPGRKRWHRIGYGLTIAWLVVVVAVSRGDRGHPMFEYIFTVPLVAWVVAVLIDGLVSRRRRRAGSGLA